MPFCDVLSLDLRSVTVWANWQRSLQRSYANKARSYVNMPSFPFALRELKRDFSNPRLWVALVGAALVLTFAGAFGSGDVLRPVPLALYWIITVTLTFGAGSFVNALLRPGLQGRAIAVRVVWNGILSGIAVAAVVTCINLSVFGLFLDTTREWAIFLGTIFAVTFVVSAVLEATLGSPPFPAQSATPALLDRLPFHLRAPLVALSVEDHYVRVRTNQGEDMILMRLSDAIRETAPTKGVQVHRSHWVAVDAVRRVEREGTRMSLVMSHGPQIPVSRANQGKIKELGLL